MDRVSDNRIQANSAKHSLIVVGGGTAGWMTAALLSLNLRPKECSITVVAEDDSGIGVGEATIPPILRLLRHLRADEAEFMQACDATWKLGIQFSDWKTIGHDYWHPFGICGARIDGRDLFPYWLMEKERPYQSYSLQCAAAVAGKSPHARNTRSPIAASGSYAFHLNARKLSAWLQQQATARDVQHVRGQVVSAERSQTGDLTTVTLNNGQALSADFFVDCSGFESVLMRSTMQDPWIDAGGHLLCDRAVAVRTPGTPLIPAHTRSLALTAGWSWEIPLFSQRGLGYVYSSRFVSDDDAWRQLMRAHRLNEDGVWAPQFLKMAVGRQTSFWKQNVLAVGLAAGFVEPLESTGLHLAQVGIERFLDLFAISGDMSSVRDLYNQEMTALFDDVLDFIQLHYFLSQREDAFWKAARDLPLRPALQHRLQLFDDSGTLDARPPESFPESSYYAVLAGHQRMPKRPPALALAVDRERLTVVMQAIQDQNRSALRGLPLHEEMLRHVHGSSLARLPEMSAANSKLSRIAMVCLTPAVDSHEHDGADLPSYGIHRVLAAVVAHPDLSDVEIQLFDLEVADVNGYVDDLLAFDPQIIGFSLFVWSMDCLIQVARTIKQKRPNCVIVFGGPSARPQLLDLPHYRQAIDYVDAVVTREGEETFCDIALAVRNRRSTVSMFDTLKHVSGLDLPTLLGWQNTGFRTPPENLDSIVSPYQMGLMNYQSVGYLESFRGCPMSCAFCEWGAKDISKGCFSEDYLTRELEALQANGCPAVFNVDAGLNLNAAAFRNLANAEKKVRFLKDIQLWCEIYPSKIRDEHIEFLSECGPSYLGVGLQSFNPDVLKRLQRPYGRENFGPAIERLSSVAANIDVQIIYGLPTDTWDGFIETLSYALTLPVTVRIYHCLVLPDALMTRGLPEWEMKYEPYTLSMQSCVGWSEQDLLDMRAMLTREALACGGTAGDFWWSFPPPSQRTTIPNVSQRHFVPAAASGVRKSA
ncbi:MAG: tryptophan 7-halogenase [Planctomycetaceae bacterium]